MDYGKQLISEMTYELVPMRGVEQAVLDLPPHCKVSVTSSPTRGIAATQELVEQLRAAGHEVIPHIAARLVSSSQEARDIAKWLKSDDIDTIFVVGGDAAKPAGPYPGALALVRDLLNSGNEPGLRTIGFASYPDGHPNISNENLHEVLHQKQTLLAEAGLAGFITTQMCFDPSKIRGWLVAERDAGLRLPVHLGIPGVISQAKLLTLGLRLGVGASVSYLRKNKKVVSSLLAPGRYDPNQVLSELAAELASLGIEGLHCFTFNQVRKTREWAESSV